MKIPESEYETTYNVTCIAHTAYVQDQDSTTLETIYPRVTITTSPVIDVQWTFPDIDVTSTSNPITLDIDDLLTEGANETQLFYIVEPLSESTQYSAATGYINITVLCSLS